MKTPARMSEPDALLSRRWRLRGDERSRALLAERYDPLARGLALRFATRGEPLDDLIQVARLGLLKCIDRFDAERGVPFASYATPVLIGELRRHFRDRTGAVHVPRSVLELRGQVHRATDDLTRSLHRPPTITELASRLGVATEDVLEAIQSGRATTALSLADAADDGEGLVVPTDEPGYEQVDWRLVIAKAMHDLDDRDRAIIVLRFARGLSQAEIAGRVGISQMHVSRLLRRASEHLRAELAELEDALP